MVIESTADFDRRELEDWPFFKGGPGIIAGPCSAESEEQVISTAQTLADSGKVSLYRAGIWKPRTRPNAFEGLGAEALPWLGKVKEATGLPVITEVANADHVELCLKEGIDALWIGARTTVNPFFVQEIASALKGVDIPVMVKNPVNPDLDLWIGAIERLKQAGLTKIAAIHRGFSSFESTPFRNPPQWQIPIELRRLMPEIPVFCDPSHITGKRDLVPLVAQRAMDLGMSGLMIETHPEPDNALSDAAQQVTPSSLIAMINSLLIRQFTSTDEEFKNQLSHLRATIDQIDSEILEKLSSRMEFAKQIGEYKKENNVTILQMERWAEIIESRTKTGESLGLGEQFMHDFMEAVHQESIRRQTEVMNKKDQE